MDNISLTIIFIYIFKLVNCGDILDCGSFTIENGQPKPNGKTMEILYTCNSNYKMIGSSTVRCNSETRTFEPSKPECIASNLPTNETMFWNWIKIFLENHLWEGEISSPAESNAEPFPRINQRHNEPITLKVLFRGEKIDDFNFILSVDNHQPILLTASEDPLNKMKLIFKPENLTESHTMFPKDNWNLEIKRYLSDYKWEFLGHVNTLKYGNCPINLYQPKVTVGESKGVTESPQPISTGGVIGISLAGVAILMLVILIVIIKYRNRASNRDRNSQKDNIEGHHVEFR